MTLTVNLIGAGHVGKTIGHLLHAKQLAHIRGVCNQHEPSTREAINFIGAGVVCQDIQTLPSADITFIGTQDAQITPCCETLANNPNLQAGNVVAHFSGTLSSDSLQAATDLGCATASIHPMRSFIDLTSSVANYEGTYCAIEGGSPAVMALTKLFTDLGSVVYPIHKDKKSLYHTGAVFASNYVVTLYQQAISCLIDAGVDKQQAKPVILSLMHSVLTNLEKTSSAEEALTGPIARGEIDVIKDHLRHLQHPTQRQLYARLGEATLPLTRLDATTQKHLLESLKIS